MLARPRTDPRRASRPAVAAVLIALLAAVLGVTAGSGTGSAASPSPLVSASPAAAGSGTGSAASPSPAASPPPAVAGTGARSLGDPFYPTLGNGGYDTTAVDLAITWSPPDARHRDGHAAVVTTLDLTATQDLAVLTLDLGTEVTVAEVRVDGALATSRQDAADRKLTVTLPEPVPAGTAFGVQVTSEAVPAPVPRIGEEEPFTLPGQTAAESRIRLGRGLIADGAGGILLAAQPNGAHTLFPVNDHPLDKATYRITLTAPPGMTGIATGALTALRTAADGSTTTTWVSEAPVASHVVSLGVGEYVLRSGPVVDGVTYRSAVPVDVDPIADAILAELPDAIAWLEDAIGMPYPFQTFGLLAYAGRPTTAILEGQTLVLIPASVFSPLGDRCRILGTIVHEAAHQWFGNAVSIARWDEKWLSEGHATYYEWRWLSEHGCLDSEVVDDHDDATGAPADVRATEAPTTDPEASPDPIVTPAPVTPADAFEARVRRAYVAAPDVRATYGPPAAPVDPAAAYTPAIYDQGALALEALRLEMGDAAFGRLQRALVRRYADGTLSTDELIDRASRIARRDLRPFLDAWLRGEVVPPMPRHPGWSAPDGLSPAP